MFPPGPWPPWAPLLGLRTPRALLAPPGLPPAATAAAKRTVTAHVSSPVARHRRLGWSGALRRRSLHAVP